MSTRRGGLTRSRPQKYQNKTAFKNDLHDKTPKIKMVNTLHICEVCERCKAQIEWKIKYKKYKPLTQQKTCARCHQKNVKKAYHVICRECSRKDRVCAKCLKSADEVNIEPPGPTEEEQLKLQVEMDNLMKSLPERKRRTFMRYMKKGKKSDIAEGEEENSEKDGVKKVEAQKEHRVPHTREDLLKKIEELKLVDDDDENEFGDSDEDEFDDSDFSSDLEDGLNEFR